MGPLLAQAGVVEVCGSAEDAEWLCEVVYDLTGQPRLAQVAGIGSILVWILLIILLALVATRASRLLVNRYGTRLEQRTTHRLERDHERGLITDTQRFRTRRLQRLQAASGVVRGVLGVVVWITALLVILDLIGVPLQPLLAGAGLVSVVIGFGAQQLVRDVLAGIAMLIEDQYGVGDWIEVDGRFGVVERVGLRSTAFRDVDGVLHHVLNGYIQSVGNLSQEWARATLDVPVALDVEVATAKEVIHRVATALAIDPLWGQDVIGPPEVWGVQAYGPEGVRIRVVIPTKPLRNWDLSRQLRERLKAAFDAEGIRMPGQLVDLGGRPGAAPVRTTGHPAGARPDGAPSEATDADQADHADHAGSTADADAGPRGAETDADATPRDADPGAPADAATGGPVTPGSQDATHPPGGTRPGAVGGGPGEVSGEVPGVSPTEGPATDTDATTVLRLRQGPRPRPD